MQRADITRDELARLLREAEIAHAQYERTLGERDEGWPDWYARFIIERLQAGDLSQDASGD